MNDKRRILLSEFIKRYNFPIIIKWLDKATTHSSFSNENYLKYNYEKLEAIGDSVLDLLTIDWLYENFNEGNEGSYTLLRSSLVSNENLAKIGHTLNLTQIIRTGKGTNINNKILADVVEAIFGGLYKSVLMDSKKNFSVLNVLFRKIFHDFLDDLINKDFKIDEFAKNEHNPKNRLQEYLIDHQLPNVKYEIVDIQGEDHDKTFFCQIRFEYQENKLIQQDFRNLQVIRKGKTKKKAQMNAAKQFLENLHSNNNCQI